MGGNGRNKFRVSCPQMIAITPPLDLGLKALKESGNVNFGPSLTAFKYFLMVISCLLAPYCACGRLRRLHLNVVWFPLKGQSTDTR